MANFCAYRKEMQTGYKFSIILYFILWLNSTEKSCFGPPLEIKKKKKKIAPQAK